MRRQRRIVIKQKDAIYVITAADIFAIAHAVVLIVAALAAVGLIARGQVNEATILLSFIAGFGANEGMRRIARVK